ncbi:DUF4138 domain-containing protein [Elizabethkingia anophelis]|uniref:DUF4138 domain-containing protein n=1 Tax=Elizabethkingia meningoseptica TaxID=238 RepID=UPI0016274C65|nr:DUF4138 domain-containing protein [Elizabethkingia meningoseptica]MCT3649879.1 DUF4138 domain-containing protein [Elizabethkingia anophelis]MCT3697054.1 DUF4138 domain-containing protein [Elizabethkingia anophelis]MCT3861009.1 DUF4138 domain-containing protein [Elizabethkingia anophelis]MCT3946798.1 DUF4138 domain-containing protein [Elizabethkingia anophelis]MCT3996390.1 DUF4138 domain-containing protein [Elizabethkingia anophelis]
MRKIILTGLALLSISMSAQMKKKTYKKSTKGKKTVVKKTAHKIPIVQDSTAVISNIVTPVSQPVQAEAKTNQSQATEEEVYMPLVKKLENKKGWISNRNSYGNRGVWAYLKGVWSGKEKIFIMVEMQNTTNINYDIEVISFEKRSIDEDKGSKDLNKEVPAIWQTDFSKIMKKSKQKLIFVFDKFTVSEKSVLQMTIQEQDGERIIIVPIASKYINGAEYIN